MRNPLRLLTELRAPASLTRIPVRLLAPLTFLVAAGLCSLGAVWAAAVIESRSAEGISAALQGGGIEWAAVATDGLQVTLTGTAPTEAARFRALSLAGGVVDSDRVIDAMEVADAAALKAPDFKIEVLRNDDGISLIGLIPSGEVREKVVGDLKELIGSGTLTDMLETAEHPVPAGWEEAVDFGVKALRSLPRSKISISANEVKVTAISDSPAEKARLEGELNRKRPSGLKVVLDISAPRPVITPFTLRFLIDGDGARFDACSAESERARDRIVAAAQAAGAEGQQTCTIGLGVPTTVWADAVTMAITALKELGAGSVTFSDADISLIAAETVQQADFDRVVGELESNLPEVFSLNAVLTPKADQAAETVVPEFIATLSDKGMLDMRGRLGDERSRDAVESYARARFGTASVHTATRITPDMPQGWPVRVLAALEALGELANGQAVVREDSIEIRGVTGSPQARDTVARILTSKLGEGQTYKLSVRYDEKLDPLLGLPTPEECVAQINTILAKTKISFEPGSAQLTRESGDVLDRIAEVLKGCPDAPIEIGGHTDAQGREEMNLALSEDRAEAVLAALMERRILTASLTATGYGETVPVADNDSETGRETNRRIEFRLVAPAVAANTATPGEAGAGEPVIEAQQATEDTPRPKLRPDRGGTDN
ncbi:MAG TPA: OmpA family protein [Albidovulum sp.]|uniref:OmpA family protein n=1 Tax=Albidovulum sp. TaxID=1872424 RepID=UPI002C818AA8|nr:OmpA family protein [Albidovulum sp.]